MALQTNKIKYANLAKTLNFVKYILDLQSVVSVCPFVVLQTQSSLATTLFSMYPSPGYVTIYSSGSFKRSFILRRILAIPTRRYSTSSRYCGPHTSESNDSCCTTLSRFNARISNRKTPFALVSTLHRRSKSVCFLHRLEAIRSLLQKTHSQ